MAFMVYEVRLVGGKEELLYTGESYSLAGRNILFNLWIKNGKPLNQGWHVSSNEMIASRSGGLHSYATQRLLVDASPNTADKIEIIEILDVWAFTHGDETTKEAWWTPLMLNIRGVLSLSGIKGITREDRTRMIHNIVQPRYADDIREFLYLLGDKSGWNWGMSGRTNAPYLEAPVRAYFREYF